MIPVLNADLVEAQHKNEIIVSIIFKLKEKSTDRFNKKDWIILKKFAMEVVSTDFAK